MAIIFLFCFTLLFSSVISNHPILLQALQHGACIVNVSEEYKKQFYDDLENGKKVFYFQVRYNSTFADNLTRPIPDNHFANPNEYMWLYTGEDGLPVYMNAPYDFDVLSMFILKRYTKTLSVIMKVSDTCNEMNVSRVQFLHLVFDQLISIVSKAPLPGKKASAYICYDINNRKHLSSFSYKTFHRLGLNRNVLLRHCCEVKSYQPGFNGTSSLCRRSKISFSLILDFIQYIGVLLLVFFPLTLMFISKAMLPDSNGRFSKVRLISMEFNKVRQFIQPLGTQSSWISSQDSPYTLLAFIKWIFLFNKSSFFVSRIRRSLTTIFCLFIPIADSVMQYYFLRDKLRIYLGNNIPLGYRCFMFGYEKCAANSDYFLGGPYVWSLTGIIFGLIIINIPDRLCETIAYSFLHQRSTCTFLIQDIRFLQQYGSLYVSNLHDYDLLYAILKSSLLTALNPSFWFAVIKQWLNRCKRFYNFFNNSLIICKVIAVCVTIPCVLIIVVLCVFELLLCIVLYGCPFLLMWKAIYCSYYLLYIKPLITKRQFLAYLLLSILATSCFSFLFLSSTYFFLLNVFFPCSYITFTVIALIAKPDAIGYVFLILVIFYFVVSILNSVSETYQSLMDVSIKLAVIICEDFVYTRLEESLIRADLFQRIVEKHHPVRYEVAKALTKLFLTFCFFVSCLYSFQNINLNLSTYIKIGMMILTTMIPKILTVLNDTVGKSQWDIESILETINDFWEETHFPNDKKLYEFV